MEERSSPLRSFRLSARTLELLEAAAAESHESRKALADRLPGEALRVERHPLVRAVFSTNGNSGFGCSGNSQVVGKSRPRRSSVWEQPSA